VLTICDEVYDELTYDFDHTPLSALPDMKDLVIYLNGFSKSYAMTGFRIGWACGPAPVIAAMTKIHQYTILCAPITGQIAAMEALVNHQQCIDAMKPEYNRRRRFIVASLNELGLDCHLPEGAFYVFPSVRSTGLSSMDFAQQLLEEERVALVPGVAFGSNCEGYVRISYASSFENLQEAVSRIGRFVQRRS
jgi:aminotransferase